MAMRGGGRPPPLSREQEGREVLVLGEGKAWSSWRGSEYVVMESQDKHNKCVFCDNALLNVGNISDHIKFNGLHYAE